MPIIVAPAAAPPVEPSLPPPKPPAPYVTWTSATGTTLILSELASPTNPGIFLDRGVMGLDQLPEEQFRTQLGSADGSLLNSRRGSTREVMLPIWVVGETFTEHEQRRRSLLAAFNPRLGNGTLEWGLPDGTRRFLSCIYQRGGEAPQDGHQGALPYSYYQLVLAGDDPYWYGDQASFMFTVAAGQPFLPGPPFYISESTTLGTVTVSIDGEVDTFPEWLITGPAASATLTNVDTGKSLSLSPNLAAGQTLLVRTDPRTLAGKKFTNSAGANVWAAVAGQFPQLWPLRPGSNTVTIALGGSTSSSSIRLIYRPRYLSA